MSRRVWVVECRIEDDDPAQFGPYTELQANNLARRINEEVAKTTDRYGVIHHPSGILGAVCYPVGSFEELIGWMTAEERARVHDEILAIDKG